MGSSPMVFAFAVGQAVEARQQFGNWIPAIITRLEPYLGRPGYYVMYPGATEMWHCHGGWKPENCLRAPVGEGATKGRETFDTGGACCSGRGCTVCCPADAS
jgi:hypothetical protein